MNKLDLGCGNNKLPNHIGIDIKKTKQTNIIATTTHLPIKTESINEIYSRRSIQHIKNDQKAINEMYRTLNSSGKIILILASRINAITYKIKNIGKKTNYPIFNHYTKKSIKKKLKKTNFTNINKNKKKQNNI